jgi:hypothetical protein
MVFINPGVAENVVLVSSEDDSDKIESAMISENIGIEPRDEFMDGDAHSFVWCGLAMHHN